MDWISGRAFWVVALVCCCGSGCSKKSSFEYDALDLAPLQEELSEFSLGKFSIPIPVVDDRIASRPRHQNRFQIDFQLHALIVPERQSEVADSWSRNHGKIRDDVIRVCRNASVDELTEPELTTLKAQLMDVLAVQMGDKGVRQLLITEVVSQRL